MNVHAQVSVNIYLHFSVYLPHVLLPMDSLLYHLVREYTILLVCKGELEWRSVILKFGGQIKDCCDFQKQSILWAC